MAMNKRKMQMSSELNSVQESIKLALDAADAATDVTSEYSQVKREHKKLEQKVSQIHRYTNMIFVTAMVTAIVCLGFTALLYFKTINEQKMMSSTNLEGIKVFSENIQELNNVLVELNGALAQQSELVALNRESSEKMTEMMALIDASSTAMMEEMKASTGAMVAANEKLAKSISEEVVSEALGQTNQLAVNLAGLEASINKSIKGVESKLVNNAEIGALSAQQQQTSAQVDMLAGQNVKILKLLQVQQDRISFP
jgi:F0F1-type ATP synthase membrane subunit b/b'